MIRLVRNKLRHFLLIAVAGWMVIPLSVAVPAFAQPASSCSGGNASINRHDDGFEIGASESRCFGSGSGGGSGEASSGGGKGGGVSVVEETNGFIERFAFCFLYRLWVEGPGGEPPRVL